MPLLGKVTITIRDAQGKSGFLWFYLPDGLYYGNVSDVITDIRDYWQEASKRLDVLLLGAIESISFSLDIPLPAGIKPMPEPESDVEEKARLSFRPFNAAIEGYNCEIPTFDHAFFGTETVITYGQDPDIDYFTQFLWNPEDVPDWAAEYGGISDNRGNVIESIPTLIKKF